MSHWRGVFVFVVLRGQTSTCATLVCLHPTPASRHLFQQFHKKFNTPDFGLYNLFPSLCNVRWFGCDADYAIYHHL